VFIREATIDDVAEIRQLVLSLSHLYLEDKKTTLPSWFQQSLSLNEFKRRIASNEFKSYVYEAHKKITGYILLKDKSHIFHMFVEESSHRKGIATMLWEHAKSQTNQAKYTVRSSSFAVPVYKRLGFKETEARMIKDGLSFQPMELICFK